MLVKLDHTGSAWVSVGSPSWWSFWLPSAAGELSEQLPLYPARSRPKAPALPSRVQRCSCPRVRRAPLNASTSWGMNPSEAKRSKDAFGATHGSMPRSAGAKHAFGLQPIQVLYIWETAAAPTTAYGTSLANDFETSPFPGVELQPKFALAALHA